MNYCFTLAYNLVSEVQKATNLLHALNDQADFRHLIVDIGFPLTEDRIPEDVEKAKAENSEALKAMAKDYGADYVRMENGGVHQNWTQVYEYLKPKDEDVLIAADPDEHPLHRDWVRSMSEVIREGGFGLVSLMMVSHIGLMGSFAMQEKWIAGRRVYIFPDHSLNWALIGLSGKFFNLFKVMDSHPAYERYGGIEGVLTEKMREFRMGWGVLADYQVRHTDYELGDPGTSRLLREWKNQIIFNVHQYGQITFEEFLRMKKENML